MLQVENVRYGYHRSHEVLHDVSFEIPSGTVTALIGPNGSGKSTLIRLISDLLDLRTGRISVDGRRSGSRAAKLDTITLASNDGLPDFLTGSEYLRFIHSLYGTSVDQGSVGALLDRYDLAGRSGDLIEDYSHGMQKKLQLVAALALRRRLTIIDETLNGIDLDALYTFEKDVRGLAADGCAVLLCSHDFAMLERVADRVLFLNRGTLAVDEPIVHLTEDHGSLDAMVREYLQVL